MTDPTTLPTTEACPACKVMQHGISVGYICDCGHVMRVAPPMLHTDADKTHHISDGQQEE